MKKIFLTLAILASVAVVAPRFALANTDSLLGSVDTSYDYPYFSTTNGRTLITGWAIDQTALDAIVTVVVKSPTLGGQTVDQFETNYSRADVARAYHTATGKEGFSWVIPARFYTGSAYDFDFYAMDTAGNLKKFGSRHVNLIDRGLQGSVDYIGGRAVTGWATDLDGDYPAFQKTAVYVTVDGQQAGMALTDSPRPDVVKYFGGTQTGVVSPNTGFSIPVDVPWILRDGKQHTIHVFALEFTEGSVTQIGATQYKTITTEGLIQ